jgi:multiple sugar transport system ATP-binding protein
VQQIDQPLKLYGDPDNHFVAGFLGSPAMNFLHGKIKDSSEGVVFKENEGGVVECTVNHVPGLKAYVGKEVILGIRPENIEYVVDGAAPVGYRFQALVDLVEPMGAETNFYLQTGAHTLICRSVADMHHSDADGHRLRFEMNTENMQFFDMETTNRIR